jgi:predicted amidophosphoribosyltransferase
MSTIHCQKCGAKNVGLVNFCKQCGSKLEREGLVPFLLAYPIPFFPPWTL